MTEPQFSVVMATYGRGRHILPSIRSVLGQTLEDFELLVVGDACTDETEAVVRAVGDPRVRWLNLAARVGSQAGPNNAGIAAAQGNVIAYLGHDDIWEPDHLERLAKVFCCEDRPDFAVSGSILHLPNGIEGSEVMGIFEDDADVSRYFFPPSSFSHSKEAFTRIGPWQMPFEIRAPVDEDLLLRAVAAGLRFRSTGVVTLHKFAAGHRYLSYLEQASDEQEEMLSGLGSEAHKQRVLQLVQSARALGKYMVSRERDFKRFSPGEIARNSQIAKGLRRVELVQLVRATTVRHESGPGILDWKSRPVLGFRKTKANPRPRLLLPVTGGRARLSFLVAHSSRAALGPLPMLCNGVPVVARPGRSWFGLVAWFARYSADIQLRGSEASLLELHLSEVQRPRAGIRGVAVGPLHLTAL